MYHGVAGRSFIEKIINDLPAAKDRIKILSDQFVKKNLPHNADGQVMRALHRMGIIAAAGTYATKLGITGWPEEEAFWAVEQCFKAWVGGRGGVSAQEVRNVLLQVRRFLELHGESRFSPWGDPTANKTINRVGFRRAEGGSIHYFVFQQAFIDEICNGIDPDLAVKILIEYEWLIPDVEGKSTRSENLPGFETNVRCYRLDGEKIFSDDI